MNNAIDRAKKDLAEFAGDEVPVADAVLIMERATGLKIHLLRTDEIPRALANAQELIKAEKVLEGPYGVKREIVEASPSEWDDLSGAARSLVGTLWAPHMNSDLVVTTVDQFQPKSKILDTLANLLEQKAGSNLGSRGKT